jgi:sugar lactone lactonase YvrE
VWHDGKILVADAINNRIQVFTDEGEHVAVLGAGGSGLSFHFPYDIAIDGDGILFVIEYGAGRLTRVSLDGRLLGRYGATGKGKGQFHTPWGVAVASPRRVWVADTGNRRLVELKL